MSDEEKQTETVEEPVEKQEDAPEAETAEETAEDDDVEKLKRSLQNKSEETARLHKKLKQYEEAEAKRKKAEMSEMERLQAERDEAIKTAAELKLDQTRRSIAEEVDLPLVLADRIKGETPEEMKADAKKILASLPKPKVASTKDASPAETGERGKTDKDRREFLFGSQN